MADLVTRLLLDNKQFDNNIIKSSRQVQLFQEVGKKVIGMLGKYATAAGICSAAVNSFKKTVQACQTSLLEFETMQLQIGDIQESFWASLNSGDATAFINNINMVASASKAAYKSLLKLKNVNIFGDAEIAKLDAEIEKESMKLDDKSLSPEERKQAASNIETKLQRKKKLAILKKNSSMDAYYSEMLRELAMQGYDMSRKDIQSNFGTIEDYNKALDKWAEMQKRVKNGRHTTTMRTSAGATFTKDYYDKDVMELMESDEYKKYQAIANVGIKKLQEAKGYEATAYQTLEQIYAFEHEKQNERQGLLDEIKNKPTNAGGGNETEEYKTDLTTIKGIQEEIKRIEEEKAHAEFSQIPALNEQISRLQTIKKLASEGKLTPDGKGVSVIDSGAPTLPNFTPVKEDNGFNKGLKGLSKNAKLMNNLARSIRGVGDAMAATGNQSKAMARSMAMVNAAASIAMMISIMIEKSKASLGIWDWIAGITAGTATVVAMAAQLRSINTSRFAEGGIVGGNNTIGDMNLVRVNSGEMILNNRQQRNLFSLLNGNGAFGGSSTLVEFKIKGKELVGVLDNYNNKMNKVR